MANKNKISAVLSDADRDAVIAYVADAKSKLPFLLSLTSEDRKNLRKMGPKSVQYVNLNLQGAKNFPDILPANFNTPEFASDVALVNQLTAVQIPLTSLLEAINDTLLAAGSDAMQAADVVYNYLKIGAANNASIKTLTAEIGKRYERAPDEPKDNGGGSNPKPVDPAK